jgi:signal peptidase I
MLIRRNLDNYQFDEDQEDISFGKKSIYFVWDLIKVVCISLAIIIPVRYFLVQPFYVKGQSMEPNFHDDEYLIIDELSYRFHAIERGDIVVFRYPKEPTQFFIKRVIGLPGEKVEVKDGYVFIYDKNNDKKSLLDENQYLGDEAKTSGDRMWVLGDEEYYVMGDNRDHSLDSRIFGPVPKDLIVGRVWLRGWPVNRLEVFKGIEYGDYQK